MQTKEPHPMKKLIPAILVMILAAQAFAGAWTYASSLTSTGMVRAWDLALNSYTSFNWVGGQYDGSMSFGGNSYPTMGESDAFIAQYDLYGNPLWFRQFGSPQEDVCLSIATPTGSNGLNNCYFTGYFNDTMSAYGTQITSAGMWDVFYGKLAPNGDLLWLKRFGGPLNDIGYGIAADIDDNCVVTGWFADSIDFGNGITLTSYGGSDMFVAKLDPQGNCLWARHGGDAGVDYGYKVDVSYTGIIYVTGVAGQGANFDGMTQAQDGLYVARYSVDGTPEWVLSAFNAGPINIGYSKDDLILGRGMVTGRVTGTAIFGDQVVSSNNGSDDIFLAEFTPSGEWTNVQLWGGTGSDKGRAVSVSNYQGYMMLASFEDSMELGGTILNTNGNWDCAILKDYPQPAALSFGSINTDVATDIKVGFPDRAITCGWYSGTMRLGNILLNSGSDAIQSGYLAMYDFNAVSEDDPVQPPQSGLSCYPNPFRGSLEIRSGDGISGPLHVFNQRGQKIRTLNPGSTNSWHWDAKDADGNSCTAGIYLISSQDGSKRQKVLLVK